jgi:hypothetical protein
MQLLRVDCRFCSDERSDGRGGVGRWVRWKSKSEALSGSRQNCDSTPAGSAHGGAKRTNAPKAVEKKMAKG